MKITVIHCHWNNRGDEAAIRAMVDELHSIYKDSVINVQILVKEVLQNPFTDDNIRVNNTEFPKRRNTIDYWIAYFTKGRIAILDNTRDFINMIKDSDIVLHGPGGPSIGDIYLLDEMKYLRRLDLIRRMGIRYAFYAPSMGPFRIDDKRRNALRKRVLEGAEVIYLRETQSEAFLKQFGIDSYKIHVSLDSAFQHFADEKKYDEQLSQYSELKEFLGSYEKVVGITTTNLKWHPVHGKKAEMKDLIKDSFTSLIDYFRKNNIGVVFIPQLFGMPHDLKYMASFAKDNCFVIDDVHDCYFQQYVISKLYAVIGMRYHSNIFSAKMGTPFISISYEQKMAGFMAVSGLEEYCINVDELSEERLIEKFELLERNYESYKNALKDKKQEWVSRSHETTEAVCKILGN